MNARSLHCWSAAAIFFVSIGLRLAYWSEVRGTALDRWHQWDQTDMATYLEQSRRIAEGDWLAREPYQPYHLWQRFAPEESWRRWTNPKVFHQAPGYSYFLALLRLATGGHEAAARFFQLIAGAGTAALVFLLASAIGGPRAGWFAGAIAAIYGPMVCIEHQLLREGPSIFLSLAAASILALHFRRARHEAPAAIPPASSLSPAGSAPAAAPPDSLKSEISNLKSWRILFLAGFSLGVLNIFHESGRIALLAAILSSFWFHLTRSWRRAPAAVAILLAGWLAGFAPLAIRNLAVGAPPFAVSGRASLIFAMSNHAQAPNGGATWGKPDAALPAILDKGAGSFAKTLAAVAETYNGDLLLFAKNAAAKIRAAWAVREAEDNLSYSFFRARAPLLRWLPGFWIVFAPGAAGAALFLARLARRDRSDRAGLAAGLFAFFYAAGVALPLCAAHASGRFRLYAVPFIAIFAALFFAEIARSSWESLKARRLKIAVAILAAAAAFQLWAQYPYIGAPARPSDYAAAANLESLANELDAAIADYSKAIELGNETPEIRRILALAYWRAGRKPEARAQMETAKRLAIGSGKTALLPKIEADLKRFSSP